ncbi:MAG: DGQHR domain-containing protein [Candidatus Aminicenantes bacterium]|nr:DGQHR domain-containing protein [Candidatus Aminicenantes bacterium]
MFLPALRAIMGDWTYYSTIMKFKYISERVKIAEEIHESTKLKDFIQRQLTPRAKEISEYLINQPQRFFNSLIVGLYGGDPQWIELKIPEDRNILPEFPISETGILGYLKLSGEEELFALDGQHRVEGIKGALKSNDGLSDEEISVIFIGHKRTPEGKERTRRLFTTLNRYAKPVNTSEIIALDEDDIAAIITRDLIEEYSLFSNDRLSLAKTLSIPNKDKECFTNIVTLYKSICELLPVYLKKEDIIKESWNKFQKKRPPQEIIDKAKEFIKQLLDTIISNFTEIREYLSLDDSVKDKARKYRNEKGGHILFRPIGLLTYIKAIKSALEKGNNCEEIIPLISKIETDISNEPWEGLFWETAQNRMITGAENQKVAVNLILYMIGLNKDDEKLKKSYASLLNKSSEEVSLPGKI